MRAFVVDTFTQRPFRGGPAGVVVLDRPADAHWMQAVAAEFNHPGTAFVEPSPGDDTSAGLRWFSPATELTLCGHATLASAHVPGGNRVFHTRGGSLTCTVKPDGAISMRFPADPLHPESPDATLVAGVAGLTVRSSWRGRTDVLLEAGSAAEVRALRADLATLAEVPAQAVIVTAVGDSQTDIVSRVFAPSAGIPEDPVTGSAHCTLASFWSPRLVRSRLFAEQASERGGTLWIQLDGHEVILTGHAVTIWSGTLRV